MSEFDPSRHRIEYLGPKLQDSDCTSEPFSLFSRWLNDAEQHPVQEPGAMILSTFSNESGPSSRVVLLKAWDKTKGFQFFTNYSSQKGIELTEEPRCSLLFYWGPLYRQVRIQGISERSTAEEADQYFNSRPIDAQYAAMASDQSLSLQSRTVLEERFLDLKNSTTKPTRPANWGGFWVRPIRFEFWQGRENRLHDRIFYKLEENSQWHRGRLYP